MEKWHMEYHHFNKFPIIAFQLLVNTKQIKLRINEFVYWPLGVKMEYKTSYMSWKK